MFLGERERERERDRDGHIVDDGQEGVALGKIPVALSVRSKDLHDAGHDGIEGLDEGELQHATLALDQKVPVGWGARKGR